MEQARFVISRMTTESMGHGHRMLFLTVAQMRAVDEHLTSLDRTWVQRVLRKYEEDHSSHAHVEDSSSDVPMDGVVEVAHDEKVTISPRPPPSAASVVHLSFPSSVNYTPSLLPFVAWLDSLIKPASEPLVFEVTRVHQPLHLPIENDKQHPHRRASSAGFGPSSLPPPSSFQNSFPSSS